MIDVRAPVRRGPLSFWGRTAGLAVTALATVTLALAACGGDDDAEPATPTGPLPDALGTIAGGGAPGSLGVGWADPGLVEEVPGAGRHLIEQALGPNAESVVAEAVPLRRRLGFDPETAERLVSVGGSYAFGLRLDGVDGRSLARALIADGAKSRDVGDLELIQAGPYAAVPDPLLDRGVSGLGAFDALGPDRSVLAISETARDTLLGPEPGEVSLLDEPTYTAAAECLGDSAAVRMVPDKLLLSIELGVDLVAAGAGPSGEVICVLGGDADRADEVADALRAGLDPGAQDPRTGNPLSDRIAAVDVTRTTRDGIETVRAAIEPAPGSQPGYVFEAISSGAIGSLIAGGEVHAPASAG